MDNEQMGSVAEAIISNLDDVGATVMTWEEICFQAGRWDVFRELDASAWVGAGTAVANMVVVMVIEGTGLLFWESMYHRAQKGGSPPGYEQIVLGFIEVAWKACKAKVSPLARTVESEQCTVESEQCELCEGTGVVWPCNDWAECPHCHGSGALEP